MGPGTQPCSHDSASSVVLKAAAPRFGFQIIRMGQVCGSMAQVYDRLPPHDLNVSSKGPEKP